MATTQPPRSVTAVRVFGVSMFTLKLSPYVSNLDQYDHFEQGYVAEIYMSAVGEHIKQSRSASSSSNLILKSFSRYVKRP